MEDSREIELKYYFAGSVRVAVRENEVITWMLSDHLGSTSVTVDATGNLLSALKYTAYGELRSGTSTTDYQYTGQRNEIEIGLYFYVARMYDPQLARFISADTIIPEPGSIKGYDRYAYGYNNPSRYTDPSGQMAWEGEGGGDYTSTSCTNDNPIILVFGGSYTSENINSPGPNPADQLPAWNWNPWGYDMQYVRYPGSKFEQAQDAENLGITGSTILVCYSAGVEACLMYASAQTGNGNSVSSMVLIGSTFTGSDTKNGPDIGHTGWEGYLNNALIDGTDVVVVDDLWPMSSETERALAVYQPPTNSRGNYIYVPSFYQHYDAGNTLPTGSNNNLVSVASTYGWVFILSLLR